MRAVIIHDFATLSKGAGATRVAILGACALAEAGAEVVYFAPVGPVDDMLLDAGIRVVCLDQSDIARGASRLQSMFQGVWNKPAQDALGNLLSEFRDGNTVVHVHTWSKALSPSIGPVLAQSGLPVAMHLHEYFLACPNGGFFDYQKSEICHRTPLSLSCLSTNCDARSPAHKAWRVVRQAVLHGPGGLPRRMKNFIYLSSLQREVMEPHLPADANWYRVTNPVSVEREAPAEIREDAPFLYVGRFSPEKGVGLFADVARKNDLPALFAGDGPMLDEIKARAPGAKFLGWVSPEEVAKAIRSSRALVFPSLWYEGMPVTIMEALACGVPVVLSDATTAREVVRDGENGLIFRSGDGGSLLAALRKLQDGDYARQLGATAYRQYWEAPASVERHVAELMTVYRKMLAPTEAVA